MENNHEAKEPGDVEVQINEGTLSGRQLEARTTGENKETVKFLNKNHFYAILIFIMIFVSAGLWTEVVITFATKIFGVTRSEMTLIRWTITALVFTIIVYVMIRYVIKIPGTSAFTL